MSLSSSALTITRLKSNMRFQLVAGLALLQLHGFAAAATTTGSDATVGTSGNHGTSTSSSGHNSHGKKPHGDHGTSMSGSKGGASLDKGSSKKSQGLPRMETFPGVHLSPVSGGVVSTIPIMPDLATLQKRAMSSAVASPDSDFPLDGDCTGPFTMGNLPKRCYDLGIPVPNVPDPVPADCEESHTCAAYARSNTAEGSGTTEKRAIPSGLLKSLKDCPIVDRRGDFLVRKCTMDPINDFPINELNVDPLAEDSDKKRAPTANEVWTRSDGGESYFECGFMDRRGEFIAKRCPQEMNSGGELNLDSLSKGFMPTASSTTKKRASSTIESLFSSSGLPWFDEDQCGIMRRGELFVRVMCCDTACPESTGGAPVSVDEDSSTIADV